MKLPTDNLIDWRLKKEWNLQILMMFSCYKIYQALKNIFYIEKIKITE